jgi:hypothetical protein
VYLLAIAAAALVLGVAVWAGKRVPIRAAAALVLLDALAMVVSSSFESSNETVIVVNMIALLVISLAAGGSVAAFAFAERRPLAIGGVVLWMLWWVLDAVVLLWVIRTTIGGPLVEPPALGLFPVFVGAAGSLAVGIATVARAKQRGGGAILSVQTGFTITWFAGELWLMDAAASGDAERIAALRHFSDVGYVGWHVVLAVLLWRSAASNLPPARVVTNRTASP